MGLFILKDNRLYLSKEELRIIPEFRELLHRDRGSHGDHDGKEKRIAFKEFAYIFFMNDYESPYGKLDVVERRVKAAKDAGLPEGYKPDKSVRAAMVKYLEIQDVLTPTAGLLAAAEVGMTLAIKLVNSINSRMQIQLDNIRKQEELDAENQIITIPQVDPILADINALLSLAERLSKSFEVVEKLQEKVTNERSAGGQVRLRGKRDKGRREDPAYITRITEER